MLQFLRRMLWFYQVATTSNAAFVDEYYLIVLLLRILQDKCQGALLAALATFHLRHKSRRAVRCTCTYGTALQCCCKHCALCCPLGMNESICIEALTAQTAAIAVATAEDAQLYTSPTQACT